MELRISHTYESLEVIKYIVSGVGNILEIWAVNPLKPTLAKSSKGLDNIFQRNS